MTLDQGDRPAGRRIVTSKERPILFSGEMVRAILEGRKTQTRRALRPQPPDDWRPVVDYYHPTKIDRYGEEYPGDAIFGASDEEYGVICKYGAPGDRLWVRETFQPLFADGVEGWSGADWQTGKGYSVRYVATDGIEEYYDEVKEKLTDACKPGIHMPRWASRITLEITGVRVERLQDISHADAIAEGCRDGYWTRADGPLPNQPAGSYPRKRYRLLWDKINGAGDWDKNPWVWVMEFKRL